MCKLVKGDPRSDFRQVLKLIFPICWNLVTISLSKVLVNRPSLKKNLKFVFAFFLFFKLAMPVPAENDLSHQALFAPNTEYPYFESISFPKATNPETFSLDMAHFLAEASMLSYVTEEDFITKTVEKAGFSDIRFFSHRGTFAFLAINDDALVLSFRGSETANKADYTTDAKIVQTKFFDYGTAHSGFVQAFEWVRSEIDATLTELQEERKRPLWVTGHSLGAALSTLYGIHQKDHISAIYPIGSPRVGGIEFAKKTKGLVNMYRIVNDNDIIPRVPTPPFYKHLGSTYYLTSAGELLIDPSLTQKWESQRKGHADLIEKLYKEHWQKGDFRAVPTDYIVDHSPRLYVEALANLTEDTSLLDSSSDTKSED